MERFAQTQSKDREIDFQDVFGGPPRRASMQERRYSFMETMNSGEDVTLLPRNPLSGLNESPVFGDESANRRRYPSDDFFGDIFRGDESLSSPRWSTQDPFGSAPCSRVLSPARPLTPRTDPFGTSLPSQLQFSLPAKLTKAKDFPAFASGNHSPYKYKDPTSIGMSCSYTPSSPLSRLSSEALHEEGESGNDIRPSYQPSPLSHESSLPKGPSHTTKAGELESSDIGGNLKKDLKSIESPINISQFHFSIYKWASKGVPLLIPVRSGNIIKQKERIKTERCLSSNGRIESNKGLQVADFHDSGLDLLNQSDSENRQSPCSEGRKQQGSLFKTTDENMDEPCDTVEEAVLSIPGSKSMHIVPDTIETVPSDVALSDKRVEIKTHPLSDANLCGSTEKEAQKHEMKPLRSFLYDTNKAQGINETIRNPEMKDSMVKKMRKSDSNANVSKHVKECDDKGINKDRAEAVQVKGPQPQDSRRKSGENLGRNGVRGKVKEFVKIFNQQNISKPNVDAETRSQSCRWKSTVKFGAESVNRSQTNGKSHNQSVNKMKGPPNASVKVVENIGESLKQQPFSKTTVFEVSKTSTGHVSPSSSVSFPGDTKVAVESIDDFFQENFAMLDAKIRQWSNGRAGNIRSLLSTLQYVLWPGSGWKTVALVDIIEGSSVKRSYQKALLCLHPDKLQQKGAASHQKYIAEKVFEILQEAWDHFNSLGSI
ncbi:J domain-containing protein required for chloroplast accumulation response 1 isoform X2 [Diospyros lotus]|uniref:J domain-containing protein required for chloroplast accumulation response 1 isoform X2 n=1 Tax=Diospyros lotus TaxID=55363 RepID=UPI002253D5BE|nr:J domain-containing protein required for chloroplast accumulation response 1 isoform X2 [Diospyros lotus]